MANKEQDKSRANSNEVEIWFTHIGIQNNGHIDVHRDQVSSARTKWKI